MCVSVRHVHIIAIETHQTERQIQNTKKRRRGPRRARRAAGGRGNAGNTLTVQRILHKDRTSGDLFRFTHLTVEGRPFNLCIYLLTVAERKV